MPRLPPHPGCLFLWLVLQVCRKRLRLVVLLPVTVVLLTSCGIVDWISGTTYQRALARGPFDAVIIPGSAFDSLTTNRIFRARILWAISLYKKGIARNLIFSGAAVHTPFVEAVTMKMVADAMGVPPEHTYVETRAQHSIENIAYGCRLADSLGFTKVAIATDPFQSLYIEQFLTRQKLAIPLLPFSLDSMKPFNRPIPEVNAQVAYVQNFVPLKQREQEERMLARKVE